VRAGGVAVFRLTLPSPLRGEGSAERPYFGMIEPGYSGTIQPGYLGTIQLSSDSMPSISQVQRIFL